MDTSTLAGIGIAVGSAGLGFAAWALLEVRRSRAAIALLQGKDAAVLPGMLPMSDERVRGMIEEALSKHLVETEAHRLVFQAILNQLAKELVSKTPYDAAQRRLAVLQLLRKAYHQRGQQLPESAASLVQEHLR